MDDRTRCVADLEISLEGYDSLTVPIHRASTIRYRDAESFTRRFERDADGYVYGLYGTPTHRHLEARVTDLHRGARTVLAPSGQAAITIPMLALVAAGERILLPDAVYGPVRAFATTEAAALGVSCEFYDPCDTRALAALLADAPTRLVWVESPGSVTMELQDLPAIVAMAHAAGALVGCDNTWASPLYCRPLEHGADLVVEAISKHLGGHSDLLLGSVTTRDDALGLRLKAAFGRLGIGTSPDDCALAMRGIDTLGLRLESAGRTGLSLARWLSEHPLVDAVLHPGLESDPGHDAVAPRFPRRAGRLQLHARARGRSPPARLLGRSREHRDRGVLGRHPQPHRAPGRRGPAQRPPVAGSAAPAPAERGRGDRGGPARGPGALPRRHRAPARRGRRRARRVLTAAPEGSTIH